MKIQVKQLSQGHVEDFYSALDRLQNEHEALSPAQIAQSLVTLHNLIVKEKPTTPEYAALLSEFGAILKAQKSPGTPGPVHNGLMVRAMSEAGLLDGEYSADDIRAEKPWQVTALVTQLNTLISEAFVSPGK